MSDPKKRRIRITVEVGYAGIDIPDEYCDLPDDWDDQSPAERDELLVMLAQEALATVATSGASVVDENGNKVED